MSLAQPSGFVNDVVTVARRAIRTLTREPEAIIPAMLIPMFFFAVNIGALQDVAANFGPEFDFKAFQLPVAIIFAVTGVSRANTIVTDIQSGYLDKMLVTPVSRSALLLGMMVADFVLVFFLSTLVSIVGFIVGVRFASGVLGYIAFLLIASAWGMAFTGFPYTVALRTGNPAAVNSSFLIFFPFAFLTSAFVPLDALTSWLRGIARYNPVTYLLEALRSLILEGWVAEDLLKGLAAVFGLGAITFTMAFSALKRRTATG